MRKLVMVLATLVLAGCAQTEYKLLETRAPTIYDGRGGTKQVVDGMDFWDNGEPPRRFMVIGVIEDSRREGPFLMQTMRGDIIRKAKAAGGDAVVQTNSNSRLVGMSSLSTSSTSYSGSFNRRGWSSSLFGVGVDTTQEVRERSSRFAVIRYVDSAAVGAGDQVQPASVVVIPATAAPSMLFPNAAGAAPNAISGIEQPGREVTGLPQPDKSGPDKFAAQEFAKKNGCHPQPVATLAMRTPGIETYSVACANGAQLLLQCQYGNCRVMQ